MSLIFTTETGQQYRADPITDRPFIQHDCNQTVPLHGRWVQILTDDLVYPGGVPRQIANNTKGDFDFPQVVNGEYGLVTRYPGFTGREYDYVSIGDDFYHLEHKLMNWAANGRLPKGKITHWYEKVKNRPTGRISYKEPVRKEDDGGWFANVEPRGSLEWAYVQAFEKGKALTDGPSTEYGMRDPVTKRNMWTPANFGLLHAPFGNALMEIAEERGIYWGLHVIDTTKAAPSIEEVIEKRRYHWGTTISRTKIGKRYVTTDFPSLTEALRAANLPDVGTPFLSIGRGGIIWVHKKACTPILAPGSSFSYYYPAR